MYIGSMVSLDGEHTYNENHVYLISTYYYLVDVS